MTRKPIGKFYPETFRKAKFGDVGEGTIDVCFEKHIHRVPIDELNERLEKALNQYGFSIKDIPYHKHPPKSGGDKIWVKKL